MNQGIDEGDRAGAVEVSDFVDGGQVEDGWRLVVGWFLDEGVDAGCDVDVEEAVLGYRNGAG